MLHQNDRWGNKTWKIKRTKKSYNYKKVYIAVRIPKEVCLGMEIIQRTSFDAKRLQKEGSHCSKGEKHPQVIFIQVMERKEL